MLTSDILDISKQPQNGWSGPKIFTVIMTEYSITFSPT